MAKAKKKAGGCEIRTISFQANGRKVSFKGRPAGGGRTEVGRKIARAKYASGPCKPNPDVTRARRELAANARACARSRAVTSKKGKARFKAMAVCARQQAA